MKNGLLFPSSLSHGIKQTNMLVGMPHLSLLANDFSSASTLRVIFQNLTVKNHYNHCMVIYSFDKYYGCVDKPPSMKPAAETFLSR
jgi:DUF1680 family protein